jgi:hypothetical protein
MNETEFNKQLEELKEVAAKSINPCVTAKYVALSDARVRALFLKKLHEGHVLKGVSCLTGLSIPENRSVYFDFDCTTDKVCLVKPAFAVVVNIVNGYVVAMVDPYTGPTAPPASTTAALAVHDTGTESFRIVGNSKMEFSDGTLPLAGDGTLPLAGDGTLPLVGDGTLPLRVLGYVLFPAGWRFGNG